MKKLHFFQNLNTRNFGIAALFGGAMALSGCSGAMVANIMPGDVVTVNGNTFTVNDTPRGVTIQNFETGRTNPVVLMGNASQAAQQVSGCPVTAITKDSISNTYYASLDCPS